METKKYEFNGNEERVLKAIKSTKKPIHLSELAKKAFGARRLKKEMANSWVRNSLRRLIRFHIVKQVDRGTYEFVGTKGKTQKTARKQANAAKRVTKKAKPAAAAAAPAAEQATEKLVTV